MSLRELISLPLGITISIRELYVLLDIKFSSVSAKQVSDDCCISLVPCAILKINKSYFMKKENHYEL